MLNVIMLSVVMLNVTMPLQQVFPEIIAKVICTLSQLYQDLNERHSIILSGAYSIKIFITA
jgi:hypothetical protein